MIVSSAKDTPPPSDHLEQDALRSIESTRGGRHWVDAQTDPPKSPKSSLECFQVEPGLRIELVAAEPLVMDPVSIAFDHRGRMFVVEYGDYPTGPPNEGDPPLSRVVMLEDTNDDGCMDRRHVFADRLNFAHSLMAYRGGMLVGAQTEILFLKDTDDDHIADVREVLFKGFTPAHPQMQIGNPRWGLDNWIYCNYGPGEITVGRSILDGSSVNPSGIGAKPSQPPRQMPTKELRFHPLTLQFGPASGLGQFGNTIDNFGHRFFCTNRNPIMTAPISFAQLNRNPFTVISTDHYDVAPSGGDARIYPLVEMKSNYLSHAGTYTAACGTTAYRGNLLGSRYANSVLVCEPIGHLITRSIINPVGATLTARRARPTADFLASTDTWFRPAGLASGPDGALYVADMYRLWVEHPKFLPEETGTRLDWRAGEDRGRIWRVVPDDPKNEPHRFDPPETIDDLIAMLSDSNGWRRHLAQRLLVERQAQDAAPALRELLRDGRNDFGRLHALWTLDGLGALTAAEVSDAFDDSSVHVRRDAVSLSARLLVGSGSLLSRLVLLADDKDPRVRFQVVLALGETTDPHATTLLTNLALRDGTQPWFATAMLTSVKERSGAVLVGLINKLHSSSGLDERKPAVQYASLVRQLATVAGARGDVNELALVLKAIGGSRQAGVWWQTSALSGLATGLPRHRSELGRISLSKLLANPPAALTEHVVPVRELLERTATMVVDRALPVGDRAQAIELLGFQTFDRSATVYEDLLSTNQPVQVHLACIEAMHNHGNDVAAKILIQHWPSLGPRVRPPALGLLLRRTATTRQALEAMAVGNISPAVVDTDRRVRLLQHRDPEIKKLAKRLFGGAVSTNRRDVVNQYVKATTMEASSEAGLKVFDRVCSKCHRIDGRGYDVGPDISDVRNRSREAVLHDILDPNQKLEPRFTSYLVVTNDGRVFDGLMVSETESTVVLRQPEGRQDVIPRDEIEEIRSSGTSLMPEGFEKDVTVQQMADLIEYLKSRNVSPSEISSSGK